MVVLLSPFGVEPRRTPFGRPHEVERVSRWEDPIKDFSRIQWTRRCPDGHVKSIERVCKEALEMWRQVDEVVVDKKVCRPVESFLSGVQERLIDIQDEELSRIVEHSYRLVIFIHAEIGACADLSMDKVMFNC